MLSNSAPLISILTTTRSDARLINAIKVVEKLSLLVSCEHIIQEAGSTSDECLSQINKSTICVYEAAPDLGIYHGMNKCLEKARGLYSIVLNSDDTMIVSSLKGFANIISRCDADLYLFDIILGRLDSGQRYSKLLSARLGQIHPAFGMGYPHGGFVAKTEILKQCPFDTKYGLEADYAQQLSLLSDRYIIRIANDLPIQIFAPSGASSNRSYFSSRNPHLSHIRIILNSPLPYSSKMLGVALRLFILAAVFPRHLYNHAFRLSMRGY
jgi:hypothetical protein